MIHHRHTMAGLWLIRRSFTAWNLDTYRPGPPFPMDPLLASTNTRSIHERTSTMDATPALMTHDSFLKAAKRLHKLLSAPSGSTPSELKLSDIQEALAQSFSFRSLHDALSRLPESTASNKKQTKHLRKAESSSSPFSCASRFAELLISMIPEEAGSMWRGRAISLISAAAIVADSKNHLDGKAFGLSEFSEQLSLDTLLEDLKRPDLPDATRAVILAYIGSLPGFDPSKIHEPSSSLREQHSYLSMQAAGPLKLLALLDTCDILLFDPSWLAPCPPKAIAFKPSILALENIEWSWLFHPAFEAIIAKKLASCIAAPLRVSDLLALQSNSFIAENTHSPSKLLDALFSRYHAAQALSSRIQIAALGNGSI